MSFKLPYSWFKPYIKETACPKFLRLVAFLFRKKVLSPRYVWEFHQILRNAPDPMLTTARIKPAGFRVPVDLRYLAEFSIYYQGNFEMAFIQFLMPLVKGKTLVDVGANVGAYTLGLSKLAKAIVAFEPSGHHYQRLKDSAAQHKLDNLTLVHRAVSNADDLDLALFIQHSDPMNFSLFTREEKGEAKPSEIVKTVTLDSWFREHPVDSVDIVKIDVEGAEVLVMEGAGETLHRFKPMIICECNEKTLLQANINSRVLLEQFWNLGYNAYRMTSTEKGAYLAKFSPKDPIINHPRFFQNLIFLHPDNAQFLPEPLYQLVTPDRYRL